MKKTIRLNNNWLYKNEFKDNDILNNNSELFEVVNLPHTNIELPYNYFDEKDFQFISCYKKSFEMDLKKKEQAKVRFEGVMAVADVYINGHWIGQHLGGYTPFEFDMTAFVKAGENILTVKVDSRELDHVPPFGGQIDYLTYGGIYRDVSLKIYDQVSIENVRIETINVMEKKKGLILNVHTSNIGTEDSAVLLGHLIDKSGKTIKQFESALDLRTSCHVINVEDLEVELWDIEDPNLYTVKLELKTEDSFGYYQSRIGFRNCEFKADGFYLNNKKIQIVGINRHQSFPYVGYAMPKRAQEKDADIIKKELHFNLVRTSHYPQSIEFLDRCDEIGLLVFEEIPGWQHLGNNAWKDVAIENVREMIERDWNHPSIIIWGVRINESADDHEFYTSTNELSRKLDPTRQTGGVRYIDNSEFLEDVYTMNDFVLDGGEVALRDPKEITGLKDYVPYLVTEYNGHMYPTKRFDNEERQMEHVKRHLRVQNEAFKNKHISGAIGWCAFDYNTHNDFGSGDCICYHGIMDMFRINKFAASVYKSQVDPKIEPVLKPVTFWARGERSIGGVLPLTILTNCDYVELSFGGKKTFKLFPSKTYDALPYPPVIVDEKVITSEDIGEWGMKWEDGIVKGYVSGDCVIEQKLSKNSQPMELSVKIDDTELFSEEKDVTRVVVEVLDQYRQLLPFYDRPVELEISGPGIIQGPSVVVPKGGAFGFWIETINETGTIEVQIKSQGLQDQTIQLKVI